MRTLLVFLVSVISAALPLTSFAQSYAETSRRIPAWVVIPSDPWEGATSFRLQRFAGNTPKDVILLAPAADAATLTQAVEALLAVRRNAGDLASADALLRVREPTALRELPWAARVLRDVHAAAPRQLPGVGRVRAVRIWLPAQRGR